MQPPRAALIALLLAAAPAAPLAAQADAWWGHITRLADDSMRGRETGSAEHRKAAEYIAANFKRAGLVPMGTDGYFQPVRFTVRRIAEEKSSIALVRDGRAERLAFGNEVIVGVRSAPPALLDAPLAFAGFGLRIPELNYDDLAGLDLKGKVVVLLGGGVPAGVPGPALASARNALGGTLRAAGAVGILTIANPRGDIPWSRSALARLNPQMELLDPAAPAPSAVLGLTLNPAAAEQLFTGTGHTYAELQALADSAKPLPRFDLPVRLQATVGVTEREVTSDNVIGMLPGTDPALKGEYLVVSAHLDHIGVGQPIHGDSIYNGAMDNASGVATLIETAGTLAKAGKLRRSVLFTAVTAEEKGLLGSYWFATHPTVAPAAIVADLNTDMFLPINPLTRLLVNGLEESDLSDDVRRAAAAVHVEVITDPEPERNGFVRSDQFSFIRNGTPSLSLKVGFVRGSPEHERVLRWRQERYHGPADDLTQPIDRQAAADFNRLYAGLVTEVANRPTRPQWYPTSIFAKRSSPTP